MSGLPFARGTYRTGESGRSVLGRLSPGLALYARIVSIVLRAGAKAKRGRYDDAEWKASSLETVRALEAEQYIVSTATNAAMPRCPNLFTVMRTWKATDTCTNASFCTQTITIIDTTPPNITCANNQIVECNQPFAFTAPTAVDACDGTNVLISIVSTTTNVISTNTFSAIRTWQATDCCGNATNCSQTVTIVDTVPPVIVCGPNITVQCGTPWSFDPPTATDNCCTSAPTV